MHDFIPLSEIQKMLVFHPMKTYRLFTKFKKEGKIRELNGWILRDNQILINMPQLYVALEEAGYKNFLKEDVNTIVKCTWLHAENLVLLPLIYYSVRTQNGTKSNAYYYSKQMFTDDDKLDIDVNSSLQMKTDESVKEPIIDEVVFTSENESKQMFTNDNNGKQVHTEEATAFSSEIIGAKDEVIGVLRESVERAERENAHLRKSNEELAGHNWELSKINFMLVAPDKSKYSESEYRDGSIDFEATVITPEPPKSASNESVDESDSVRGQARNPSEAHTEKAVTPNSVTNDSSSSDEPGYQTDGTDDEFSAQHDMLDDAPSYTSDRPLDFDSREEGNPVLFNQAQSEQFENKSDPIYEQPKSERWNAWAEGKHHMLYSP